MPTRAAPAPEVLRDGIGPALAAGLDPADYPVVPGGVPQAWERAKVYLGLCERYQELYQAQVAELHLLMASVPGYSLPLSHRRPLTDPLTDTHTGYISLIRARRGAATRTTRLSCIRRVGARLSKGFRTSAIAATATHACGQAVYLCSAAPCATARHLPHTGRAATLTAELACERGWLADLRVLGEMRFDSQKEKRNNKRPLTGSLHALGGLPVRDSRSGTPVVTR